ncbi:MAG: dipeptide ABC transporter ATP-binding protein [Desulfocapsaceae bacterium]|jgi:microcin C transport system ATP-binding protein|nr:dipeptide ABC transporter ATP-binding protein [Desulfocapsaceae bacterium]
MKNSLLSVNRLSTWFANHDDPGATPGTTRILDEVTLAVDKRQTVALVGESGSGKSVTALTVLRLLEEISPVTVTGTIRFKNRDLLALPREEMRSIRGNQISMIFQEPMTSLNPVYTVGNQLMEPLILHRRMSRSEARREAVRLLERTEINNPEGRLNSYPRQLSGGQRQRVMIAMALACNPALLIADEPTTALDVTVQAQILRLLKTIQQEDGMAILLITHDLTMVKQHADFIYIMKSGRIIESGTTHKIFTEPESEYAKTLLAAIPTSRVTEKKETSALLTVEQLNCHFKIPQGWASPIRRNYSHIRAVDDVSMRVEQGTTCGVIGESGSGKTTLGLAVLKLIKSTGKIYFKNDDLQAMTAGQLRPYRNRMQIVFQDPYSSLSPRMTIREIIGEGLRVHHKELNSDARHNRVAEVLEEVGLDNSLASRYPHEFSGGQRQRIAIARAIILRPELLILDEPTSALDMTVQTQIIDLLQALQKKYNLTYIFISHDLRVIRAVSDQIIVMKDGKIIESGPSRHVFENPVKPYTQELFSAALAVKH